MLLKNIFPLAKAILAHAEDGLVDLNDLGMSDFSPYSFERNPAWIAMPALSILIVLLHLKRNRKKKKLKGNVK